MRFSKLICVALVVCSFQVDSYAQNASPAAAPTLNANSSNAYESLFEQAVEALINDEPDRFKSMLSESLIKRTEAQYGAGFVDKIIKERFIPFFYDFERIDPNVTVTKTSDADGNEGMAFFRTFIAEDQNQKPFVVYVVNNNGRLVVGNVVVGKTFRDLSASKED